MIFVHNEHLERLLCKLANMRHEPQYFVDRTRESFPLASSTLLSIQDSLVLCVCLNSNLGGNS